MVLFQPPSASVERIFLQVAQVITFTWDKGPDDLLDIRLFENINKVTKNRLNDQKGDFAPPK